jgi:phosphoglycolate phosphatase
MMDAVAVFDLDGTLVDSSLDIHAALRVALAEVDDGRASAAADERAIAAGCHGLPLEVFFARARPAASRAGLLAFVAAYRRHYHAHLLDYTRPFPGVEAGLERLLPLRRAGLKTAVATTKLTDTARKVVVGLGLSRHLDLVLGSDGLPCKPDPAVIRAVFRALRHPEPPSGLMVGDTELDILAGRAAGLRTCAVGWSELPRERLSSARPDHHAQTFDEVVALIEKMAERPGSC